MFIKKGEITDVFSTLVGEEFYFFGVDYPRFILDDMVLYIVKLEITEYFYSGTPHTSSRLSHICHDDIHLYEIPRKALAKVKIVADYHGWLITDVETNHVWLEIGTTFTDEVMETTKFIYNYKPDEKAKSIIVPTNYKPYVERNPEIFIKHSDWFTGLVLNHHRSKGEQTQYGRCISTFCWRTVLFLWSSKTKI